MPPEAELIELEADGATVSQQPQMFSNSYNLIAFIQTDEGEGPGEVRVRGTDGRLLATFPFSREAKGAPDFSSELTTADFFQLEASDAETGLPVYRVHVLPQNTFGELLGAEVRVEIEVQGGEVLSGPSATSIGPGIITDLVSDGLSSTLEVTVSAEGEHLETWTLEVELAQGEGDTDSGEVAEGDASLAEVPDQDASDTSSGEGPRSADGGCGGCQGTTGGLAGGLWWLLCLALVAVPRRKSRC